MNIFKRAIAATELLLIFPAALFMMALFVRNLQPLQYEPARTAQRIVDWYAVRPRIGLWGLLIALPLAVLLTGCSMLLRNWSGEVQLRQAAWQTLAAIREHLATLLIAGATLTAGGILAIVALHMLTDGRECPGDETLSDGEPVKSACGPFEIQVGFAFEASPRSNRGKLKSRSTVSEKNTCQR